MGEWNSADETNGKLGVLEGVALIAVAEALGPRAIAVAAGLGRRPVMAITRMPSGLPFSPGAMPMKLPPWPFIGAPRRGSVMPAGAAGVVLRTDFFTAEGRLAAARLTAFFFTAMLISLK
jgi:hypothetical protein